MEDMTHVDRAMSTAQDIKISAKGVQVYYGDNHAIKDVNVAIDDKTVTAFIGPSGCGKSTSLRMIAGLEDITGGEVLIGGRVVNELPPRERNISMVFQNLRLFPNLTALENIQLKLKTKLLNSLVTGFGPSS